MKKMKILRREKNKIREEQNEKIGRILPISKKLYPSR